MAKVYTAHDFIGPTREVLPQSWRHSGREAEFYFEVFLCTVEDNFGDWHTVGPFPTKEKALARMKEMGFEGR